MARFSARPGIRAQLMLFLCSICLLLLGLFWFLSTQMLEPLYNRRIEEQLSAQADGGYSIFGLVIGNVIVMVIEAALVCIQSLRLEIGRAHV